MDWLEVAYRCPSEVVLARVAELRAALAADYDMTHIDSADGDGWAPVGAAFEADYDMTIGAPVEGAARTPQAARAVVELGPDEGVRVPFEVRATTNPSVYRLTCGTFNARLDAAAPGGWALTCYFSGRYWCEGHDATTAMEHARSLAEGLGWQREHMSAERLRRIDLAADMAGLALRHDDQHAWVKPRRGQVHYENVSVPRILGEDERQHDTSIYWADDLRVSGLYVCRGNPLQLCAYDKRRELERDGAKREAEEEHWRTGGWNGEAPVTRVELRLRGDVLREFQANGTNYRDDVQLALANLDAMWSYATGEWARLVDRSTATRLSRCATDPRWQVVQQVTFAAQQAPAVRRRLRRGADVRQTHGTVLSFLAGAARLVALDHVIDADGEVLPVARLATMDDSDCEHWLTVLTEQLGTELVRAMRAELVTDHRRQMRPAAEIAAATKRQVDEVDREQDALARRRTCAYMANRRRCAYARAGAAPALPNAARIAVAA